MDMIVTHFKNVVKGVLNGFDRIVFKGYLRPFMIVPGVNRFCQTHGILNKNYKSWMMEQTEQIISDTTHYAKNNSGHGIVPISCSAVRKEQMRMTFRNNRGYKVVSSAYSAP